MWKRCFTSGEQPLTITEILRMVSQCICRGVVGNVLVNTSTLYTFPTKLLPERFYLICQAVLAAVGINGLTLSTWMFQYQLGIQKWMLQYNHHPLFKIVTFLHSWFSSNFLTPREPRPFDKYGQTGRVKIKPSDWPTKKFLSPYWSAMTNLLVQD